MDDKMAKCHMCLLGLIILCPFFKGTSGKDETHVFCSSAENVRLPCNNALSNCTSTTWSYNKYKDSQTNELIAEGKTKQQIERLSLESDCSLNIKKVTKEDYGLYTCRQYVKGQQGTDTFVYLHVLHVSSSSSQTDIRPGSSVTLSCRLYSYNDFHCDTLVHTEGIQLIWVNQAGVSVMTDSRNQISFSSTHCKSTLTTTLLNEDLNSYFRCQIRKNELKTSATTSNKYSSQTDTTPVIPVHTTNSEELSTRTTSEFHVQVISAVAAALAVVLVAVFWVIYKKRADNKRGTDSSVVKDVNEHKGTYETINMSIPSMPNANEQTDDVTYSEVTSSSKKQVQKDNDHSNDTVTYSTIRGAEYTALGWTLRLCEKVEKIPLHIMSRKGVFPNY
ncbi:uncharacterized protein LOC127497989 isoform X2 [Ctenopharyngodon idella]|uniref:uncharacterized protein LOC127497989 isoform X2 n=1 Tax=Ctenopharyngodon idella TaxID=7959 RepID=UPI00222E387F|nr:uncharacterized protein LOC127497989 isoform X2 [Ctenopharyngodon idella]